MAVFKAADVIELALQIETNGEAYYRAVAAKATHPDIHSLFEELAQQEVYHYQAFQRLAKTAWDQPLMSPEAWDDYLAYLNATVQSAFFEGKDKSLSLAGKVANEKEAIRMAMGFEKETLLFFYDLREMIPVSEHNTLARIIAEERTHLRRLAAMLPQGN